MKGATMEKKSVKGTRTEHNLMAAFAGESQARNRYTYYAGVAKNEGLEQISAIFIENQEEKIIKISFRSQGDFDVNEFARNHFNGGGHINAAGGKSEESLSATVAKFVELVHQLNI